MLSPSRRPKKCKQCKQCKASFAPNNPLQVVCSPLCALEYAKKKRIKEEVKQIRERKLAIKTLPDFKKEAEQACHAYVRGRRKALHWLRHDSDERGNRRGIGCRPLPVPWRCRPFAIRPC